MPVHGYRLVVGGSLKKSNASGGAVTMWKFQCVATKVGLRAGLLWVGLCFVPGCQDSSVPATGGPPVELAPLTISGGDGTAEQKNTLSVDFQPPEQRRNALEAGDTAPALSISRWLKGDALQLQAGETVYVVEFWATWCGPCLMSMPHIAELQTKYGDKVQIVGVTDEEPQVVEEFLKKMAPGGQQTWEQLLTYRLALDANGGTNAAWMQAAGQQGIPCAFIVGRQGKVEWIGHPMTIDKPLQQVVDGTWDIQRGKRESVLRESVNEALTQGNFQRALNLADELLQLDAAESGAQTIRIMALFALGRSDEANAAVAAVIEREQEDAAVLNQLAWLLATGIEKGDVDLQQALRAAERAVELDGGRDANSLDTLARVHFRLEQYEQAISRQRQAIEQAPEGQREAYESVLKEYEAKSAAVPPGQQ